MNTPIRLLVIDDEVALTRSLKLNLEDTGRYEVHVVNDPTKAVATALEVRPQVVFLDLMMPRMDGGDVALAFRENTALVDIPIVFLTALVRKSEEHDLQLGGHVKLGLAKPITLAEVDAAVKKLLNR